MPSVAAEDERHLHRMLMTLQAQRTRQINRRKGLLASQGITLALGADFMEELPKVRVWNGSALLPRLQARLRQEHALLEFVEGQILELERERRAALRESTSRSVEQVRQGMRLCGIGENSAW